MRESLCGALAEISGRTLPFSSAAGRELPFGLSAPLFTTRLNEGFSGAFLPAGAFAEGLGVGVGSGVKFVSGAFIITGRTYRLSGSPHLQGVCQCGQKLPRGERTLLPLHMLCGLVDPKNERPQHGRKNENAEDSSTGPEESSGT